MHLHTVVLILIKEHMSACERVGSHAALYYKTCSLNPSTIHPFGVPETQRECQPSHCTHADVSSPKGIR
jgi:hypothetical protein